MNLVPGVSGRSLNIKGEGVSEVLLCPTIVIYLLHYNGPQSTTLDHIEPRCTTVQCTAPHCTKLHHSAPQRTRSASSILIVLKTYMQ